MTELRCLVTGATGAVGPQVVAALCGAGYKVRTLSLSGQESGLLPDSVEQRIGDVTDAQAVASATAGCGLVLHLAALLHQSSGAAASYEEHRRVNCLGTANVVRSALRYGVGRVLLFSTISVYGPSAGGIADEESPPRPDTAYARTKLEAERELLNARRADGRALGTVLRLAAVYGPNMKGNYRRLARSLARGRFIPVGSCRNRRTLVYEQDVARAALLAAEHPAAAGRVYNVTDGRCPSLWEVIQAICGALGRRPPRLRLAARTGALSCRSARTPRRYRRHQGGHRPRRDR